MKDAGGVVRFKLGKSQADIDRVIRFLVPYAYQHIPMYRDIMRSCNIDRRAIRCTADLVKLPLVSKKEMLSKFPVGVVKEGTDPLGLQKRFTSGSTGVPFAILYYSLERWFRRAGLLRALSHCTKLRWPLRIAELGIGNQQLTQLRNRNKHSLSLPFGYLRPFVVDHVPRSLPPDEQMKRLYAAQPDIVTGHPSLLQLVAERLLQSDSDWKRPRLVVSRGEVLSSHVRELITDGFGCRVVDFYNCEEIGNIAWQCPLDAKKMHVNHDLCWFEAVDDDGLQVPDGKAGRVVVTSLYNTAMPFVRYMLDDRAMVIHRDRCECGYQGTTISLVEGRDEDFIFLPDGERVSPRVIDSLVGVAMVGGQTEADHLASLGLMKYQIIQETLEEFTVRLSTRAYGVPGLQERMQTALQGLHPKLHCSFELHDELLLEPSGKHRAILSKVTGEES